MQGGDSELPRSNPTAQSVSDPAVDEGDRRAFALQLTNPAAVPVMPTLEAYARTLGFDIEQLHPDMLAYALRREGHVWTAWIRRQVEASSAAHASIEEAKKVIADARYESTQHLRSYPQDEDSETAGFCAAISRGGARRYARECVEAEASVRALAVALADASETERHRTAEAPTHDWTDDAPHGSPYYGLRASIAKRNLTLAAAAAEYQANKAAAAAQPPATE